MSIDNVDYLSWATQIRTEEIQQSKCWAFPLGDSPILFLHE